MTLELKHLASYLPYKLKFELNLKDVHIDYKDELRTFTMRDGNVELCLNHKGKPILRPLYDLTKEIDGVVHLVELAKIHMPSEKWSLNNNKAVSELDLFTLIYDNGFRSEFAYEIDDINNQLHLYNYLFQHHFDVYGLIEKGLAIDINTIENV